MSLARTEQLEITHGWPLLWTITAAADTKEQQNNKQTLKLCGLFTPISSPLPSVLRSQVNLSTNSSLASQRHTGVLGLMAVLIQRQRYKISTLGIELHFTAPPPILKTQIWSVSTSNRPITALYSLSHRLPLRPRLSLSRFDIGYRLGLLDLLGFWSQGVIAQGRCRTEYLQGYKNEASMGS